MGDEMTLVECARCEQYNLLESMVAVRGGQGLLAVCASTCVRPGEVSLVLPRVVLA